MSTSTEGGSPARRGIGFAQFITSWWRDLFLALSFFTRLPVGFMAPRTPEPAPGTESATIAPQLRLGEASRAFPLAGLVVGLAGGLAYWIAVQIGLSGLL